MLLNGKRILRVFPRKTKATPDDCFSFVRRPLPREKLPSGADNPSRKLAEAADEIHISVTFTYDIPTAEKLYKSWARLGVPVKMGGPALDSRAGEFIPGLYLKQGYTITSRGCNGKCWFCDAWRREGPLRELEIKDGWIVTDNNLLGCSESHIRQVFEMLARQPQKPRFTGGIEARLLKPWHAELMRRVGTARLFCAYDTPDDYEPLVHAGRMFRSAGFTTASHALGCYVLVGYPGDTFDEATVRLRQTISAGFVPYAMLYRDKTGNISSAWRAFQREWCNPYIVGAKLRATSEEGAE